jgi:hypothetical protein
MHQQNMKINKQKLKSKSNIATADSSSTNTDADNSATTDGTTNAADSTGTTPTTDNIKEEWMEYNTISEQLLSKMEQLLSSMV